MIVPFPTKPAKHKESPLDHEQIRSALNIGVIIGLILGGVAGSGVTALILSGLLK